MDVRGPLLLSLAGWILTCWLAIWSHAPSAPPKEDELAAVMEAVADVEVLVVPDARGDVGDIVRAISRAVARQGCVLSGRDQVDPGNRAWLQRAYATPGAWQGVVGAPFDREGFHAADAGERKSRLGAWAEQTASNVRRLHADGTCVRTVVVMPGRGGTRALGNALRSVDLRAAVLDVRVVSRDELPEADPAYGTAEPIGSYAVTGARRTEATVDVAVRAELVDVVTSSDPLFVRVTEVGLSRVTTRGLMRVPLDERERFELVRCLEATPVHVGEPDGARLPETLVLRVDDRQRQRVFELTHPEWARGPNGVHFGIGCLAPWVGAEGGGLPPSGGRG